MHHRPVIIGAGLTGLSCAHHLADLGSRVLLVEQHSGVGGLATTERRGAFHFDRTGHWLHFGEPSMRSLVDALLPGELVTVTRRAAVAVHGARVPYPFQAHTFGLPTDVVADCVLGYFRAREAAAHRPAHAARDLETHIRQQLGDGIAEHFMIPYNSKLWTVPPSGLDPVWCARFVPIPTPEEVVLGALRPDGAGHAMGYNAEFYYPRQGGIGRLAQRLRQTLQCELRLGQAVQSVDRQRREITLSDGSRVGYGALVSTMPLPDLIDRLDRVPDGVRDARQRLRAVSVTHWDIGVAGANAAGDPHWTYFPDRRFPFYRVGSPSAVQAGLAPAGHRSYYAEVSHPRGSPVPVQDEDILQGLRGAGLLASAEQPVLMCRSTIDCGYAVMDHHYCDARATLLQWLKSERISSVGRYGAWVYDSMEDALRQGRDAAKTLRALT